jgi:methanogenic corrinoid protein MtbC1
LVILATVRGDVHDIGKNLVGVMLEGAGCGVVDLGVNARPEEVLERANEPKPNVVRLPALSHNLECLAAWRALTPRPGVGEEELLAVHAV